ncbi:MAG TPA: response regulator [Bacteroidales bacterium]|nr:response regulator [Bacteroidales bacterium]
MERKMNILIAEDNVMNQELIRYLIQSRGWECRVVDDGQEALEEVGRARYDVILMDIQMPRMNGIEATRAIRHRDHLMPIIAITAAHEAEVKAESLRAGMNDLICKPYRKEDLFSSIERCLSKSA